MGVCGLDLTPELTCGTPRPYIHPNWASSDLTGGAFTASVGQSVFSHMCSMSSIQDARRAFGMCVLGPMREYFLGVVWSCAPLQRLFAECDAWPPL